jgi:acetoin:2,6-dichlorophenolindophenol oxidoreductase subunit alpha
LSEVKPYENPLVPNKKLRQMYVAMAEARILDEHIAKLQSGMKARRRLESTHGQEACRVSTTIELEPGDMVSDSQAGVVMDLLAGAKVDSQYLGEVASGEKAQSAKSYGNALKFVQMPWIKDGGDRLKLAMGAALSFKASQKTNVVVAFVPRGEISKGVWRDVLDLAAKMEMPIIFVVLPDSAARKNDESANISRRARAHKVPGIAVDANDAVAIYRVMQESMGRARSGGGPVLIECIAHRVAGERHDDPLDPLVQMSGFLLSRKVCTKAWLERAGGKLRNRIEAVKA